MELILETALINPEEVGLTDTSMDGVLTLFCDDELDPDNHMHFLAGSLMLLLASGKITSNLG